MVFIGMLFESEPWEDIQEMVENLWLVNRGYSSSDGQIFRCEIFWEFLHMRMSTHAHCSGALVGGLFRKD